MRNWLIRLLGGYTKKEWAQTYNDLGQYKTKDHFQKQEIAQLKQTLREARKNDHRDSKGRFKKGKDNA